MDSIDLLFSTGNFRAFLPDICLSLLYIEFFVRLIRAVGGIKFLTAKIARPIPLAAPQLRYTKFTFSMA